VNHELLFSKGAGGLVYNRRYLSLDNIAAVKADPDAGALHDQKL
jgi:hypothetical protein